MSVPFFRIHSFSNKLNRGSLTIDTSRMWPVSIMYKCFHMLHINDTGCFKNNSQKAKNMLFVSWLFLFSPKRNPRHTYLEGSLTAMRFTPERVCIGLQPFSVKGCLFDPVCIEATIKSSIFIINCKCQYIQCFLFSI